MGSKRDEVSLHPEESEDSFYGFSDEETFNEKLNAKEKATPKEKAQISSKDKKNDIKSLRELLGIPSTETQYADDDDITSLFGTSLENLPRMTIEVDADQISDTDDVIKQRKRTNIDMSSALFDDDEAECDTWELPRLKAPDKGKPISPSLAKITNKLFGDEVSKEIKACDSVSYIGRNDNFVRGRGPGRYPRRGGFRGSYVQGGYEDPYPNRYQPYPYRGQYRSGSRPYGRGFKRSANAVATPPNPHPNE
ncbi:hypothetical protein DPMN_037259 [Dreissena polymorpha]|uniref:Uncharacterized protein n=1 Tax=Dreissena polymorpha TaxID=45954 RepID=A0A9D4RNY3_DREPO|nr:hypothetical protein DPMN_037259 [Dreissena polymorpha]